MALLFSVRNDSLWLDNADSIRIGVCAAMTAKWVKATLDNGGPLRTKSDLTGAQPQNSGPEPLPEPGLLRGVESFYRDCAQVQARFRNGEGKELRRKLQMFRRIGLPLPDSENIQVSHMMSNQIFIKNGNGVYSFDIKGKDIWHTLGAFVDKGNNYYQYFDPESGLYEFVDDRATSIRALSSSFENAGVADAEDLPCIRYLLQ